MSIRNAPAKTVVMFVVKWKQTLLLYKANPLFYKLERWPQLAGLFKQGNALKKRTQNLF